MPSSPCNLQQGNVIASLSHRASPAGWGVQVGYIRGGGPQWCVASLPYFDLCLRLRTLPFTVLIVSHSLLRIYERIKERTNGRTLALFTNALLFAWMNHLPQSNTQRAKYPNQITTHPIYSSHKTRTNKILPPIHHTSHLTNHQLTTPPPKCPPHPLQPPHHPPPRPHPPTPSNLPNPTQRASQTSRPRIRDDGTVSPPQHDTHPRPHLAPTPLHERPLAPQQRDPPPPTRKPTVARGDARAADEGPRRGKRARASEGRRGQGIVLWDLRGVGVL
ncbi:hypothetical protein EYC84_003298 [Monilinia fructicola]|uniref:Uncharacterized protein n=1 Tax=Monilinia fructicola TaxID=38448 RepID=A0A5M9JVJ9_MONFR|nr:hypothetical protein EYC84_003298 [Monilinia fructicola]